MSLHKSKSTELERRIYLPKGERNLGTCGIRRDRNHFAPVSHVVWQAVIGQLICQRFKLSIPFSLRKGCASHQLGSFSQVCQCFLFFRLVSRRGPACYWQSDHFTIQLALLGATRQQNILAVQQTQPILIVQTTVLCRHYRGTKRCAHRDRPDRAATYAVRSAKRHAEYACRPDQHTRDRERQALPRAPAQTRETQRREGDSRLKAKGPATGEPKTRPTGGRARNTRDATAATVNSAWTGGDERLPPCDEHSRIGWSDHSGTSARDRGHGSQAA